MRDNPSLLRDLVLHEDVEGLKISLEEFRQELYSASESFDQKVSKILTIGQRQSLEKALSAQKISPEDTVKVDAFITQLISELEKINVVVIRCRITPSYRLLREIKELLEKHLSSSVVLDVVKDDQIIAGAVIEWEGQKFEYMPLITA